MTRERRWARFARILRTRIWIGWLLVALIAVVAGTGVAKLRFDDELVRFFDSDIPAFQDYVALGRNFESDGNDVIALVEAPDLAAPEAATALTDFLLDAQFIPGVRAAISPFSLRLDGAPLYADPPLPVGEMAARLDRARGELPLLARLMAADRSALLILLPISEANVNAQDGRHDILGGLGTLARRAEADGGVTIRLTGYPVLRDEVSRALSRDVVRLLALGIALGLTVAIITLRSVRLGLLTLPGPALAVALGVGLHGHLGVSINTVTITLPVLILVLATSDAVHISFERGRQAGRDAAHAAARAIRRVATACLFAASTTAIAFGALATSRSEIIAEMGLMGALVALTSVAVVLLTQLVVFTNAGRAPWFEALFTRLHDRPPTGFGIARLPHMALARPRLVTGLALALLLASTLAYSQAGPRYSFLDSLRDDSPMLAAFQAIEAKVAPVSQIHVIVNSTDPQVVARVGAITAETLGASAVQSLADVDGGAEAATRVLPEALSGRLLSETGTQALVSVPFAYVNGQETLALTERLETALTSDPALDPALIGPITGLPVMSSRVAGVILDEINRSLLIALAGVALLIFAWLRNLRVALIALVPNMLPVTLIGGWLMLSGAGITFSNGLALTVAFGIAVDDTLHVLNRLRLAGGVDHITREKLEAAFGEVAPALVTTSLVLFLGTSGSMLAENRGVAEFGAIAMSVFVLALIADLLVLPAALATLGPRSYLRERRPE